MVFAIKSSPKLNKLCKLALIRDGSEAQAYLQAHGHITKQRAQSLAPKGAGPLLWGLCPPRPPALPAASPSGRAAGASAASQAKPPRPGHGAGAETAPVAVLPAHRAALHIKTERQQCIS